MTYEEALKLAEEQAGKFPTTVENGRETIEVDGRKYPKDWFVRACARMKAEGKI